MSLIVPVAYSPLLLTGYTYTGAEAGNIAGMAPASLNTKPDNFPSTCVDNDDGDIYHAGYVTYKGVNYVDACVGSKVNEMVCAPGKNGKLEKSSVQYPCPYGCLSGACKTQPVTDQTCTDTDRGIYDYIAGSVSGYKGDGSYYSYSDYCLQTDKLVEYYCNNNQPFFTELPCTNYVNGSIIVMYACEDGACIYKGIQ
jgi:hypothetical protein